MRNTTQNRWMITMGVLGFGMLLGVTAEAALEVTTATIDFRPNSNIVTIRARFSGITKPSSPNDLRVRIEVKNITTQEAESWEGTPTVVR